MNTSGLLKKTVETIPMDTEPIDSQPMQDQKNFKTKMRSSGYTEEEISRISEQVYPSGHAQVFRYIDMLDYIPCRCGEAIPECYPCRLNRQREEFGGDSEGGPPAKYGLRKHGH